MTSRNTIQVATPIFPREPNQMTTSIMTSDVCHIEFQDGGHVSTENPIAAILNSKMAAIILVQIFVQIRKCLDIEGIPEKGIS